MLNWSVKADWGRMCTKLDYYSVVIKMTFTVIQILGYIWEIWKIIAFNCLLQVLPSIWLSMLVVMSYSEKAQKVSCVKSIFSNTVYISIDWTLSVISKLNLFFVWSDFDWHKEIILNNIPEHNDKINISKYIYRYIDCQLIKLFGTLVFISLHCGAWEFNGEISPNIQHTYTGHHKLQQDLDSNTFILIISRFM